MNGFERYTKKTSITDFSPSITSLMRPFFSQLQLSRNWMRFVMCCALAASRSAGLIVLQS